MHPDTTTRWFDPRVVLDSPATLWTGVGIVSGLVLACIIVAVLARLKKIGPERLRELVLRLKTWAILIFAIGLPIMLGSFWTILGVLVLSILCYREFARVTGLFRNYAVSAMTVAAILFVFFAVLDHWYGFFAALPALGVCFIVASGLIGDRPNGFLQRVALAVIAYLIFGISFGHVGYIANDPDYRGALLLLLLAVELNDVFAYIAGNLFGKRKLAPNTSPNKTIGGALGAVIGTTVLVSILGPLLIEMPPIGFWLFPLLGVILSISGQLGDLVMSAVKRDLGIKDTGCALPGHCGFLDRFDSLMLAGPAFFHYIGYFRGFGLDEPVRILTIGS
ncbi:MAG: phosphatidate cytidylyltransferase [Verrucomicrobiales bacterium]|jgi:phosphatidate cytidylyltransferase